MSSSKSSNFSFSDDRVTKKGSGIQLIFGVLLLIISLWLKLFTNRYNNVIYILLVTGITIIHFFFFNNYQSI